MVSSLHLLHESGDYACRVICGDSSVELRKLEPRSIDLVVTSPPYFQQRKYAAEGQGNEETVVHYLENLLYVFAEVVKVMKPTGNIVYNLGDKIVDGSLQLIPCQFALRVLGDCKLRLVNDITWVKSNPTPHQFSRRLIASTEPFYHFALGSKYYYDRNSFMPADRKWRSKPSNKLGLRYRQLINSSNLNEHERDSAHKALDEVIADVHEGKIHSFQNEDTRHSCPCLRWTRRGQKDTN